MEKRITQITINNYRGYYGEYDPMNLENGENLLIYGENGSGKSSLYKALNNFLLSSRNTSIGFTKNKYNEAAIGEINIQISDFDSSTKQLIDGTQDIYKFSDTVSNHDVPFIKDTALVKGFLDYTDLLSVYFHKEPEPNLFNLIVLTLLGEYIPVSSGGNFKFREKWRELQEQIIEKPYTTQDLSHKRGIEFLPEFELHLKESLNLVFQKLNSFLLNYFKDLNIQLDYTLLPIEFNYTYGDRSGWKITHDLRLKVIKDGEVLPSGYNDFLNEARLSAISICLYLASLRVTNKNFDLKILYLDDVFIGLDSGNRIPILNILRNEFPDFQKIVSTYDRYWFELAKRHFDIYKESAWKTIELYVGYHTLNSGQKIDKPIIIDGESHFEKAIRYLHHNIRPDYPAAANYFRKALEELIHDYMVPYDLINDEGVQLAEYKLSQLLYRTKRFLERSGNDIKDINVIVSLLHTILHPLSHHEISSPVYKYELILIETAFLNLRNQLKSLDRENYQCKLERGKKVRIKFIVSSSPRTSFEYEIKLKESLILKKTSTDFVKLKTLCHATKLSGIENDKKLKTFIPDSEDPNFNYNSLADAVEKLCSFLNSQGKVCPKPHDYLDAVESFDGTNWQPLQSLLIWKTEATN